MFSDEVMLKWEEKRVRIIEFLSGATRLEIQCWVCGRWKPLDKMKYVCLDKKTFVPVCGEECRLAFCLGREEKTYEQNRNV